MPNRAQLREGDRIRLLCVPAFDLQQRQRELHEGMEDAGSTATTIERIIAEDPIVEIVEIDRYGTPWFERELTASDGAVEYHSVAVLDDDSWEHHA